MTFAHPHYQNDKHPHIRVVDGLRSIAIVLVIWYHLWLHSWLSSNVTVLNKTIHFDILPATGYMGVEILLFITGFGLFYPYATHIFEGTTIQSIRQYSYHRIVRIVPSYYLAVLIGIVFFTAESMTARQNPLWHIFTHLTFIHLFFTDTNASISTIFWTLGTEAQFYVIFPLIAGCFQRKTFITFGVMVVVAYIFRYHAAVTNLPGIELALRQMPAFLDIYACGMLTAYIMVMTRAKLQLGKMTAIVATVCSIVVVIFYIQALNDLERTAIATQYGRFLWLAQYRIQLGLIFMTFTLAMAFALKAWRWLLTNKIMLFLSVISYNWYLWHYMVLLELKVRHIPSSVTSNPYNDPIWQLHYFWLAAASGLLIATLVTFAFERPLIKYGFRAYLRQLIKPLLRYVYRNSTKQKQISLPQ